MAVKKHKLVHDNRSQLDLVTLARYIELINGQPDYLPTPSELIKYCQEIVKCLARASSKTDQIWEILQSVDEFLVHVVNSVDQDLRNEIVTAILEKFYTLITDPQSDASPVMSIVLVVLDGSDSEAKLSAARWLVKEVDNGPAGAGLRAALSCLYRWLIEWHGTPSLGDWVMAYIKALEENERFDVLIEVSVDNIGNLFLALENSVSLRTSVAEVIFHVLASLRESTDALDRISTHLGRVLETLADNSGQWSRQVLQYVVDISTAMLDHKRIFLKGESSDAFKAKYQNLSECLERYMDSGACRFLQLDVWSASNIFLKSVNTQASMRKVGLLNLGNTCYMNSVMQALLVTRQFSSHVMMRMSEVPYWSQMGMLFAKMLHSHTTKLNPDEFFSVVKPPFFTTDHQHDSSEFLGYLFELLKSYEYQSDENFDYTKPPVLSSDVRRVTNPNMSPPHSLSDTDNVDTASSIHGRSTSPKPGSSATESTAPVNTLKRPTSDRDFSVPIKKRFRGQHEVSSIRRESFVDNMFAGVLLTRVECTECHSSSLSRDVFRDLQLAFPEKSEGAQYSVQGLLEFYCSTEKLTGDNMYDCRDCGVLRNAERSVLIENTPKYLILILKNFKFEPKLQVQTKLMHPVHHNETITLPAVRSQADHSSYGLYAAVIHAGTTLDSGHYYTIAKDHDQWHIYNDDVVSSTDDKELKMLNRSSTPYILFYRRADIEEGTAPFLHELPPRLQECLFAHNKHYVDTLRGRRMRP